MSLAATHSQPLETAVLFLVFNRPETTQHVFEAIRSAKPPRLYVSVDGPRDSRPGEAQVVEKVKEIATAVDWPCEIKTLFREKNLGCKKAVSSGIDWFFENEEQGIILEDDCLPNQDFFVFCELMLKKYNSEDRVWAVTGNNFQDAKKRGDDSYYFSRYNHIWGWATWRRAWAKRDMDLSFWPIWKNSNEWKKLLSDTVERKYWGNIFDKMYAHKIDTWDYPWTACVWYHNGLTVTPNFNLVSNIGFGSMATHTIDSDNLNDNLPVFDIPILSHPKSIVQDTVADRYVFDRNFGGADKRFPRNIYLLPRRILNFILRKFNS